MEGGARAAVGRGPWARPASAPWWLSNPHAGARLLGASVSLSVTRG